MLKIAYLRLVGLVAALILMGAGAAQANLITTFDVVGTYQNGAELSGTLAIDTTLGAPTGADITVSEPYNFAFTAIQSTLVFSSYGFYDVIFNSHFDLAIPGVSLVGYAGGTLLSLDDSDSGVYNSIYTTQYGNIYLQSGELTASSTIDTDVPEPSSGLLLGTVLAVLMALGGIRRVIRTRNAASGVPA